MTMLLNPGHAREARKAAIASLDKFWGPSPNHSYARGAVIGQDEARKIAWRMSGGVHYQRDYATLDAVLLGLVAAGLLVQSTIEPPGRCREFGYARPEVDVDPTVQSAPQVPVTMWHPADGSEPRPWLDVEREQREKREKQAPQFAADSGTVFGE